MRLVLLLVICLCCLAGTSCGSSAAFEPGDRQVAEGNGLDPHGGKGTSLGGYIDPNGRSASLRAEWMD